MARIVSNPVTNMLWLDRKTKSGFAKLTPSVCLAYTMSILPKIYYAGYELFGWFYGVKKLSGLYCKVSYLLARARDAFYALGQPVRPAPELGSPNTKSDLFCQILH